ncbi:MAG TPA: hypothetical protein PLE24_06015 [Chitinispirillaceae bacterium]|nr:hypothetical protein [Chitinispirillaceae bacterium]
MTFLISVFGIGIVIWAHKKTNCTDKNADFDIDTDTDADSDPDIGKQAFQYLTINGT